MAKVIADFVYDNKTFTHVDKGNTDCTGCWFFDNDIPCNHSVIPYCDSGIFVLKNNV